ncbi:MAG: permease [Bacteroidaceae bacterium]|nr:permease [Bacteroidaceae bacterium]
MKEMLDLINQMSPYVLLGFLFAGLMHAFIPNNLYSKYLGGRTVRSVINAIILSIPLPLCSCGVIPTAMSLRRDGASKGATTAFLISTPQTGIDSIIATYSILGLPFAILRPVAAIITAILGGILGITFADEKDENSIVAMPQASITEEPKKSFWQKMAGGIKYAFVDMMQDIGRWLVAGLVIAGIITAFVPDSFFEFFAQSSLLSMLMVLLLAIPMYLCATGSIPIAVALMLKGLSPGTALVLLMAGPAVNTASMLVVNKVMGRRSLLIYIGSIIAGAIAFGMCIDYLLPREWFLQPLNAIHAHSHHGLPVFNTICSVALLALLVNAFIRRHNHSHHHNCECGCGHHEGEDCSCKSENAAVVICVEGMSCNHCKASVEKALKGIAGVETVTVDLVTGEAAVTGAFDRDEAVKAVEAIGFTAKLKEV